MPHKRLGWASIKQRSASMMSAALHPTSFATISSNAAWCRVAAVEPSFGASARSAAPTAASSNILEHITGCKWDSVFTEKALRSSALCKWMARFGMIITGCAMRTNFSAKWPLLGSRTITLPARPNGRSNQVCQSPPPYVWMPTCNMPVDDICELGRRRRQGESVCAPTMDKPESPLPENLPPTTKAMTSEPPFVTKYFPPGLNDHGLPSCSSSKPLAVNNFAQAETV
mmetsp:Transcript_76556/g.212642  ORF Transcript_76556/g.212642 Transcript_76556/m.212642 type:complete len:228 (-) Transcript_76556:172-855(-)